MVTLIYSVFTQLSPWINTLLNPGLELELLQTRVTCERFLSSLRHLLMQQFMLVIIVSFHEPFLRKGIVLFLFQAYWH